MITAREIQAAFSLIGERVRSGGLSEPDARVLSNAVWATQQRLKLRIMPLNVDARGELIAR